jgi:hypothetical protein
MFWNHELIVAMLCILIGVLLGLRFKVLILLPAVAVALPVIIAGGVVHGDRPFRIFLCSVLAAAAIQFGYVLGACARLLIVRASRLRAARKRQDDVFTKPTP